MSIRDWMERIQKEREIKRTKKLRKKYGFLMDELESMLVNSFESLKVQINGRSDDIIKSTSSLQNEIGQASEKLDMQFDRMDQVLEIIVRKIEEIQKNNIEEAQKSNKVVEDKSKSILMSIDEVKTLMKIVAVNNLLDEI